MQSEAVVSQAKIQIVLGSITFSGEGEQKWLSEQLDKLLEKGSALAASVPDKDEPDGSDNRSLRRPKGSIGTLASFLAAAKAGSKSDQEVLGYGRMASSKGPQEHYDARRCKGSSR